MESLGPVKGILPIALEVKKHGIKGIIVPEENAREAAMVEEIEVYPLGTLSEVVEFLNNGGGLEPLKIDINEIFNIDQKKHPGFFGCKRTARSKKSIGSSCSRRA